MSKITKLTEAQKQRHDELHAQALAAGMSTQPADRARAEAAIRAMYAEIGEPEPAFLWCDSPATCTLASNVLRHFGEDEMSSLWSSLWSSLALSLESSLASSLGSSLGSSLRSSLESSLESSLWSSLRSSLESSGLQIDYAFWGQHELAWWTFYQFCEQIGVPYDAQSSNRLKLWLEVGYSAGWWFPYKGLVIISERPAEVHTEAVPGRPNERRLHRTDGPALRYRDGWPVYAIHGVRIDNPDWVEDRSLLTVERIQAEQNTEVRRVMISEFGQARYLREANAVVLDQHDDKTMGTLWKAERPGDTPLVMLQCLNGSPEPLDYVPTAGESGEWIGKRWHKFYWIRVRPTVTTVREAQAWIHGLGKAEEYAPLVRT